MTNVKCVGVFCPKKGNGFGHRLSIFSYVKETNKNVTCYFGNSQSCDFIDISKFLFCTLYLDLLWGSKKNKNHKEVLEKLQRKGFRVHPISDILPDKDISKYRIHKQDRHPNPLAYQIIAEYIVSEAIG